MPVFDSNLGYLVCYDIMPDTPQIRSAKPAQCAQHLPSDMLVQLQNCPSHLGNWAAQQMLYRSGMHRGFEACLVDIH